MYCLRLVSNKLNMTFLGLQSFISLQSFMFVSAAVSELRESNQNKKEKEEIGSFQFNTFPEHIIHSFFNLLSIYMYAFNL